MKKIIAVLTSGGDCAGLNAVMRAIAYRADELGWRVLGIKNGTAGLLEDSSSAFELRKSDFDGVVMRRGGTILGANNSVDPFAYKTEAGLIENRSALLGERLRALGVQAVVGIGGDGSFEILSRLAVQEGINFIGVPKTIDNDVGLTDFSVGFDTAVEIATQALDRLHSTAASHDRVMVLEVMGRDAGHIALSAGLAGGADVILIPEIAYDVNRVAQKIQAVKDAGRSFALVVVSEAVKAKGGEHVLLSQEGEKARYGGVGMDLARALSDLTGFDARATVLGHLQRGGSPNHTDRILAQQMGVKAVDLIAEGAYNRMVACKDRAVTDVPISEVVKQEHCVDLEGFRMKTARALGVCFGDDV